jgi:nicotinate-nucleotide adenylyltransferase
MPIAVYVRPGAQRLAPTSRAAMALERFRIDERAAGMLALRPAPAWVYLHGKQSPLSSSLLRAHRHESAK